MFSDPQTVTINTVATSLPRVAVGNQAATYTNDDGTKSLSISHAVAKNGRVRRMARLDIKKIAADPFITGNNREVSMSAYLVIDEPQDGIFSNTEVLNNVKGLLGWHSDANVTKVIAGES